jgi:hypothetical protein
MAFLRIVYWTVPPIKTAAHCYCITRLTEFWQLVLHRTVASVHKKGLPVWAGLVAQ